MAEEIELNDLSNREMMNQTIIDDLLKDEDDPVHGEFNKRWNEEVRKQHSAPKNRRNPLEAKTAKEQEKELFEEIVADKNVSPAEAATDAPAPKPTTAKKIKEPRYLINPDGSVVEIPKPDPLKVGETELLKKISKPVEDFAAEAVAGTKSGPLIEAYDEIRKVTPTADRLASAAGRGVDPAVKTTEAGVKVADEVMKSGAKDSGFFRRLMGSGEDVSGALLGGHKNINGIKIAAAAATVGVGAAVFKNRKDSARMEYNRQLSIRQQLMSDG